MHINIKDDGNSAPFIEAQEGILTFDAHGRPSVLSLAQLQALVSPGGTPQNMQVAWTPTNLKLGELVGFIAYQNSITGISSLTFSEVTCVQGFIIQNAPDLTSVSFPNLTSVNLAAATLGSNDSGSININSTGLTSCSIPLLTSVNSLSGLKVANCSSLTAITLSAIVSVLGGSNAILSLYSNDLHSLVLPTFVTAEGGFDCDSNHNLTHLSLPAYIPSNAGYNDCSGCALPAADINAFLARFVANAGFVSGTVDCSGGTNAAPTGQGIVDKATLIGRGVTVATN